MQLNKNNLIAIVSALAVVILFFVFGSQYFGQIDQSGQESNVINNEIMAEENQNSEEGLQIEDVKVGSGREAKAGQLVTVHYVGTLTTGEKFDSSVDRGEPFQFILGIGQVIQGWDQGFNGMKVGGKRKLVIPPELAYGERAIGSIPAGSTLLFEVELLGVQDR